MPRNNIRQKFPSASSRKDRKVSKRRGSSSSTSSSSLDLSDDGGYSAVEDISDSEDDDEEDVDAAEEKHILKRGLNGHVTESPRPAGKRIQQHQPDEEEEEEEEEEDDEQDDEDEDDGEDDDYVGDVPAKAVPNDDVGNDADADDNASWDGIVSEVDETANSDSHATPHRVSHERHVRFDVPDSESDSTDTDDDHADFFPDLFVDQNTLDPSFRREIEQDDDDSSSTVSGGYWDFHGVYEYTPGNADEMEALMQELVAPDQAPDFPLQDPAEVVPASAAVEEDVESLDGYETDGETTEEDDDPVPAVRQKTARRLSVGARSDVLEGSEPPKSRQRGQPRLGHFNLDSSERKPIAVVNPITKKMMIFTPHRQRHLDLSPEQFNMPQFDLQSSPMVGSSAHIMMSAMYTSTDFGDMLNSQAIGPAEAFFPFPSEHNTADESSDFGAFDGDDDIDFEGEDVGERSLDIDDFLTFDAGSDDEDNADPLDDWCQSDAVHSTPARPTTASSDMDMLAHSHINASNVGAFRRDQINQRLILSEKATQDSLALSSPYNYSTLRGIKSDRFETASAPLTPVRRQRKHSQPPPPPPGHTDFAQSPLASMSQKRKASSEQANSHKRHRSISDVNNLHL